MAQTLLAIDNDQLVLLSLKMIFQGGAIQLETATSGQLGLAMLRENPNRYAIVLLDYDMRTNGVGMNGDEVAREIKKIRPDIKIIMVSGHETSDVARACREAGAEQFMVKGTDPSRIEATVKTMLLSEQNDDGESERQRRDKIARILRMVGQSRELAQVGELVTRFSDFDEPVLILGESGAGKEGIARAIHENSRRRLRPFLAVNCAAVPKDLLESELFGHERGAFTNAVAKKVGLFEQVSGGTIFLDEIGDMPYALQSKILRVLQEKVIQPVGGIAKKVEFRVVAATHRNLKAAFAAREFREDLYFRLNYLRIEVPPLRERPEDIEPLARHFLHQMAAQTGQEKEISAATIRRLKGFSWPGNVRHLEAVVKKAFALADSRITPEHLGPELEAGEFAQLQNLTFEHEVIRYAEFENLMHDRERALLIKALEMAGGVKSTAAALLGISPNTMHSRRLALGLDHPSTKTRRVSENS